MKHFSHLNTAVRLLTLYEGQQPFALFLKEFFRTEKKYGSKDRKRIAQLCYCYFRLGKALPDWEITERLLLGLFLCTNESDELLIALKPDWIPIIQFDTVTKLQRINISFSAAAIFPVSTQLSDTIDANTFYLSHFVQPDLFLRLRPGQEDKVKQKLQLAGFEFKLPAENCIALPNSSRLEEVVQINKEAVVQDYSSQRVGDLLPAKDVFTETLRVWDCCAASGGKSIMAYDQLHPLALTVSDIRENILVNLRKRFEEAGIRQYSSSIADLRKPVQKILGAPFDLIIADVPCTGSGTWGRTPEQLFYFKEESIEEYVSRQKQIVMHALQHLKPGGYFLYCTCSVFAKENEEMISYLQLPTLVVLKQQVLTGYNLKADTLFAALLQKTN